MRISLVLAVLSFGLFLACASAKKDPELPGDGQEEQSSAATEANLVGPGPSAECPDIIGKFRVQNALRRGQEEHRYFSTQEEEGALVVDLAASAERYVVDAKLHPMGGGGDAYRAYCEKRELKIEFYHEGALAGRQTISAIDALGNLRNFMQLSVNGELQVSDELLEKLSSDPSRS